MTTPRPEALHELAAAYALGALDPDEARAFERQLAGSPELQRELAAYREVAALLALGAPRMPLDPALKQRLLQRVAREQTVTRYRRPRRWLEGLAWAAALAGLVVGGALALKARAVGRQLAQLRAELDQTRSLLRERENTLNAILGPGTVSFTLSATGAREPSVQVFWNRTANRWVMYVTSLRPAPRGRAYQLWFLHGSRATPSITFNSSPGGTALVSLPGPEVVTGLTAAAITEEPESGSPQPTSTPILVGQVRVF